MSHFRKHIAGNGDKYSDIVIMDWVWAAKFSESFFQKFKLGKVSFGKTFLQYLDGLLPKFCGKSWLAAKTVYTPFNIKNTHWVALEIDLVEGKVNVCDSSIYLYGDEDLQTTLEPLCTMLPALLKESGHFSHLGQILESPFKVDRFRDLPQNSDG